MSISFLFIPFLLHSAMRWLISLSISSPSPSANISKNSAMGSGLHVQGPPATTKGSSSPLSDEKIGTRPSSSIYRTFVYDISYWRVKPITSKSHSGVRLSSENSGTFSFSICSLISNQGAKNLSHHMLSSLLRTLYMICVAWLDIAISYVSGKQKANLVSTLSGSLYTTPSSPPVYLAGFCTLESILLNTISSISKYSAKCKA